MCPVSTIRGFMWIPRPQTTKYFIKISGIDVTEDVIEAEFTKTIQPEIGYFKLIINNNGEVYSNKYSGGEEIEFLLDFSDGTTTRFKGKIAELKNVYGDYGYVIEVVGDHIAGAVLDITVTESYDGTTSISNILKDIIPEYLTGFTYNNVESCTDMPKINWSNKAFWACVTDLCNIADYDCYVDDDKDFHFFKKGSKENIEEAIIWDDTLIEVEGLGTDTVDVKNKVIIYGEDNRGLPIIYTAEDSVSQSKYDIKETIIRDSSINTMDQAKRFGDAQLILLKEPETKGRALATILPDINPGEKIWISLPTPKILGQYKVSSLTHRIPLEQTECIIEKVRTVPHVFRERVEKEVALEAIKNPYKMEFSYNFFFDDYSEINDGESSANITISEGCLIMTLGTSATMVSNIKTATTNIGSIHLKIVGDSLAGTSYWVMVDDANWESIALETQYTMQNMGKRLKLKIQINSINTKIDSVSILYK